MARNLPPLNAIRVFDTAARLESFSRAADELAVTHSAVSKQIATLEDFVGAKLFDREAGGVILTHEGRRLRDAVNPAMTQLQMAFGRFSRPTLGSNVLRVATAASFAAHVLMPALPQLQKLLPDIELQVTTSDRPLDLTREAVDVAIRYGDGRGQSLPSKPLFPGRLLPVVHPDQKDQLASLQRIQAFSEDEWLGVDDPLANEYASVLPLEHFVVAIEAALAGVGFALLPDVLVARFVDDGRLRRLPMAPVAWPMTFNLIHDPTSPRVALVDQFVDALNTAVLPQLLH